MQLCERGVYECFDTCRSCKEACIMWTQPAYTDLRLGFDITLHVSNR
ncbi:pyrroloquinoline quinone precursor peptide PqqA [Burkholderia sp. BCC1977]